MTNNNKMNTCKENVHDHHPPPHPHPGHRPARPVAGGGFGIYQQKQASKRFEDTVNNVTPSLRDLNGMVYAFMDIRSAIIKHSVSHTAGEKAAAEAMSGEADKKLDDLFNDYEKNLIADDHDRQLIQDDKAKLAAFRAERNKYFDMSNSGKEDLADAMLRDGPLNTTGADLRKALNAHTEYNLKLAFNTLETNKAAYNASLLQTSGMIAGVVLLVLFMGVTLFRTISRGLTSIQHTMQQVSQSLDFTQRAPVISQDEIGHTATAFNNLLGGLQTNLKSILEGARSVALPRKTCRKLPPRWPLRPMRNRRLRPIWPPPSSR
jgi:methyl-accepting chemotaxis protein